MSHPASFGVRLPIAERRIASELKHDWNVSPDDSCDGVMSMGFVKFGKDEDLHEWTLYMRGPGEDAPCGDLYKDQTFYVKVLFSSEYPIEPPEVTFLEMNGSTVPLHPHVYSNGHICLDILYNGRDGGWSPALTIKKVMLSLLSMLSTNTVRERPKDDSVYCLAARGRSPSKTGWVFHDDTV